MLPQSSDDHGVTDDGEPTSSWRLLEGEDLKRRVKRLGTLPPYEARAAHRAGRQCARSAHPARLRPSRHQCLTRLPPRTSRWSRSSKVLDFGIPKHPGGAPLDNRGPWEPRVDCLSTYSPISTPLRQRVDFRADLWALGGVAYFMLTRRVPFGGRDPAVAGRHAACSRRRPGAPVLPRAKVRRLMQQALAARSWAARFGLRRSSPDSLDDAVRGKSRPAHRPSAGDLGALATLCGETAGPTPLR